MNRVKQQHYVPRFYLRRFASAGEQIQVFDKHEVRSFSTNLQNVAAEQGFLDAPQFMAAGLSEQFMEKTFLRSFEEEGASALRELLGQLEGGTFRKLRGKRRQQIARFLTIQSLRTREHRESLSALYGLMEEVKFRARLSEEHPEIANDDFYLRPATEAERLLHVLSLLNLPLISKLTCILMDHIWCVWEAPADMLFWTSDNPAVRHGHVKDPVQGTRGFASRGVEIAFPLSPRFLLALAEAKEFHFMSAQRGLLQQVTSENVKFYNSLQLIHATRFVFASGSDFSIAETMCRKSAQLRDPSRPRIEVHGGPWSNLGGRKEQ